MILTAQSDLPALLALLLGAKKTLFPVEKGDLGVGNSRAQNFSSVLSLIPEEGSTKKPTALKLREPCHCTGHGSETIAEFVENFGHFIISWN